MAASDVNVSFYNDPAPYDFPTNCYPTNDDVIHYYITHIDKGSAKDKVRWSLAKLVKSI